MSGNKFAMSLMNPIGIPTVLGLVYAGYPVDLIFRLTLTSINGINNKFSGSMRRTEGSPDFYRLLEILRRLQGSNILSINVTNQKDIMINFALGDPADSSMLQYPGAAQDIKEVAKILGIDFLKQTYKVDYGTRPGDSNHILMKTRSLLEILTEISNTVEVPEEHLLEFQTIPTSLVLGPDGAVKKPLLVIHSSKDEPLSAFFSIRYNDYWFYLDKNDYHSKKVFSFLLFLCALSDTDDQKSSPVLTIPAN